MPLIDKARLLFTAIKTTDLDAAVAMISPSAGIRTPLGVFIGGEAYCDWIMGLYGTFQDIRHEIDGFAAESGQTLAFELRVTGTFTGTLKTPASDVSPTGKAMDLRGGEFWRFEGGLIVEYHLYFDQLEFLRQIGLSPA